MHGDQTGRTRGIYSHRCFIKVSLRSPHTLGGNWPILSEGETVSRGNISTLFLLEQFLFS